MGLLDDAIREHLELKRRRGADPSEVERDEREALGPVRRNRDAADVADPEDGAAGSTGFAYDQAEDEDWSHDSLHESDAPDLSEDDFPDTDSEAIQDPPAFPEFSDDERDSASRTPPAPSPSSHRVTETDGNETVEYDIEKAMAADGDRDEDVLEETPEFLQDAPDHDRLWFEQRPPRDFDFDG
jgi:hypothetical protein